MKHHAFVVRPERFSTDRMHPGHQMFTILKEACVGMSEHEDHAALAVHADC